MCVTPHISEQANLAAKKAENRDSTVLFGLSRQKLAIASFRTSISIAKGGNHGISFTSAVGPQIAPHGQNLLGGRNLLGDVLADAIQRDASAAVRGVGHS